MTTNKKPSIIVQLRRIDEDIRVAQAQGHRLDETDLANLAHSLVAVIEELHEAVLDSNSGADDAASLYSFLSYIGLKVP